MKIFSALLSLGLGLTPVLASAQWQWLDNDGKRVFSDRAPGAEIPAKNILKQPGGARPVAAVSAAAVQSAGATPSVAAASASAPGASVPKLSTTDKSLEAKKKQAEDAEAAKRKADEERVAAAKAENCARAKQSKALYDSGVRVARATANGEREVLDDAGRAEEIKRAQSVMATDCK